MRVLLEHGADVSAMTFKTEEPLLLLAVRWRRVGVVRLLLAASVEVSARDNDGDTALHNAASHCQEEEMQLLLDHSAHVSPQNNYGRTPLHEAALQGHETVVRRLLGAGADFSAPDKDRRTPLHQAARQGRDKVRVVRLSRRNWPSELQGYLAHKKTSTSLGPF